MIVALYARVSTNKQAEKVLSIPDQLRQMREWGERQGHAVAVEYVDAGASATDDRRPEFERMITEACRSPKPFDAIIVHSLSRFFRDHFGFVSYERRLTRAGVKLISITQPTGEEASGEMVRQVISLFDEYQSKENGKHTLRAMKENARQGYFNGSRPPFGYRTEAVEAPGRQGKKRRVAIDAGEAASVRKVFALYLRGEHGRELGDYGIARALNRMGVPYRGKPWTKGRVQTALTNRAYVGEWIFNRRNHKTGRLNPPGEWVVCAVPPLVPEATFLAVQRKRERRQPKRVPPRLVSSPTFLAGLVKCGECGAGMTLMTGKGGRYRYYSCNARRSGQRCQSANIPTRKLDAAVRLALAERVCREERVGRILAKLQSRWKAHRGGSSDQLRKLRTDLERNRKATEGLASAIEAAGLPVNAILLKRVREREVQRQAILAEIAGLERERAFPVDLLSPKHVEAFCRAVRAEILDETSEFGKRYLGLLVEEVRVDGQTAVMRGSEAALAQAVSTGGEGISGAVPRFGPGWLPKQGSNLQPSGSQPLGHIGLRFEGSFRRWGVNSNDHLTNRQHFEPWHGHLAAGCEANSHPFGPSVASPESRPRLNPAADCRREKGQMSCQVRSLSSSSNIGPAGGQCTLVSRWPGCHFRADSNPVLK